MFSTSVLRMRTQLCANKEDATVDKTYSFDEFCGIIEQLRSDNGCPWDKVQTHTSLKQCLIEEAYEVLQGIDEYEGTKNPENLKEELGDVMLQVVMHSVIAKQEGIFTIDEVIDGIAKKMIRRHPHVFGSDTKASREQIHRNWDEIKKQEKADKHIKDDLTAIPLAFPALIRAQKVVKKAQKIDKENLIYNSDCLNENLKRILQKDQKQEDKETSFGVVLFELCKLAHQESIDAEKCLSEYVKNYIKEQK